VKGYKISIFPDQNGGPSSFDAEAPGLHITAHITPA
jgi:hypothetical protein